MHSFKLYLKTAIICFLVGGIVSTIFSLSFDRHFSWQEGLIDFIYSGILTAAIWMGNGILAEKLPISWVEQPIKRLFVSLSLTIIYTVGVAVLTHAVVNAVAYGRDPIGAIRGMGSYFIISVLVITFIISLFLHGRAFLLQWKDSIIEAERLKQAQLSSRFESLKNQVNPHFLFNSLNVLSGLVYKDADLAAKFIKHLADVYRYVLDTRDLEVVPLVTELEALQAYIFLLQIRFGENLDVGIDLSDSQKAVIPPLTLQMLVENAVKHNIASRSQPLHIHITQEGNEYIIVKNNLQKKSNEQASIGIGLANIQERYRYISDQLVKIVQDEHFFIVYVPLIQSK
ncbi:MAG: histidine kinase [Saprospiraceae bacterium]|nr:histidine kinase [Saprospiraceae bacterium]